jgi:hypothetical protein
MGKWFGSIGRNDSNVQDYVAGAHAVESGTETEEVRKRREAAEEKLPANIKKELDDRLGRGTI